MIFYRYNSYPNPDIENTMIAQVLNAPKKSPKSFITNKVYLVFADSLCTLKILLERIFTLAYMDVGEYQG